MKKYGWPLFVVLFAATGFWFVAWLQSLGPDEELVVWQTKIKWAQQYWPQLDYAVIGASEQVALSPKDVGGGRNGINLSAGGAQPPYFYYQLERFTRHNPHVKDIYMTLFPTVWTTQLRNNNLIIERFVKWYADDEIIDDLSRFGPQYKNAYKNENWVSRRFYPYYKMPARLRLVLKGLGNRYIRDYVKKTGGQYVFGELDVPIPQRNLVKVPKAVWLVEQPVIDEMSRYYFHKILELQKERGFNLYFLTNPYPSAWKNAILNGEEGSFKSMLPLLRQLKAERLIPVPFLDINSFSDGVHLNYNGANQYAEFMRECALHKNCDSFETLDLAKYAAGIPQ